MSKELNLQININFIFHEPKLLLTLLFREATDKMYQQKQISQISKNKLEFHSKQKLKTEKGKFKYFKRSFSTLKRNLALHESTSP